MSVQGISFLAFWFMLLLSHAAECRVTNGVEERLSALEHQGQEQASLVIQQSQEIQQLNAELKFYKDQVHKYIQQNDDQATAIGELSATLQEYKELAIENQKELSSYKTELGKQEATIGELSATLQDYTELAIENQKELSSYKTELGKQEATIGELSATLQDYKELAIENQKELSSYKTELGKQETTIGELANYKTELGKQERKIKALEEEALIVDKSAHVNQHSESDVRGSPNSGLGLEEGQMKLTGNTTHVTDGLNDTTNKHKRLAMGNIEGPVAFHATTDKGIVTHIGVNQNLALDVVLLNLGNGYHNQHGLFIAPVGGVYSFSASLLSSHDPAHREVQINIMKNGLALGRAYAHSDSARFDQGAITVVTQLVQGDEVWVAVKSPADAYYYGERYTSFSGFLLY